MGERESVHPPVEPPPLVSSSVLLLTAAGATARRAVQGHLAAAGLSLRDLGVLGHLRRTPGMSYSELARRAHVTPQSMQATVARLEAAGTVERVTAPGRGRTAALQVTDDGRAALERATAAVAAAETEVLTPLSPVEREQFHALLARLVPSPPAAGSLGG